MRDVSADLQKEARGEKVDGRERDTSRLDGVWEKRAGTLRVALRLEAGVGDDRGESLRLRRVSESDSVSAAERIDSIAEDGGGLGGRGACGGDSMQPRT